MNKKVVIVSGIQIINNPRVVKEANVLSNEGFDVEVIGGILDAESVDRTQALLKSVGWKYTSLIDLSKSNIVSKVDYTYARFKRKILLLLKKMFGFESPSQLGYFVSRLLKVSIKRDADLYIVHTEQGVWIGEKLLELGKSVAVDIEDWYSEDGLVEDRKLRPMKLLSQCESYVLRNAVYATTTSKSLSYELNNTYQCPLPKVVYNCFPSIKKKSLDRLILDRKRLDIPSIIWFSQTIGPGRGLEQLISVLNDVDTPFELHIRGTDNREFSKTLISSASNNIREQIYFHEQVSQQELPSRLGEHDIGYCGELSDCKNRDLTITNKMFEYLRAGLAIIASDTRGQCEVEKSYPELIHVFKQNDQMSLFAVLNSLLLNSKNLMLSKDKANNILNDDFGWSRSRDVIRESANSFFLTNDMRK